MRRVILAVCSTVAGLVLLLGYKSQSAPAVTSTRVAGASSSSTSSGSSSSTGSTASGSSGSSGSGTTGTTGSTGSTGTSGSTSTSTTGTKTATGDAADTRYGPVQVKVTTVNGKITAVDAVVYPQNSPRDQEINSFAIPQLNQETLAAGSASIDVVSGATYTSDGYAQSLQSALDKLK